jgi:hypothetical protein
VAFTSRAPGKSEIREIVIGTSGETTVFADGRANHIDPWLPDGSAMLYHVHSGSGGGVKMFGSPRRTQIRTRVWRISMERLSPCVNQRGNFGVSRIGEPDIFTSSPRRFWLTGGCGEPAQIGQNSANSTLSPCFKESRRRRKPPHRRVFVGIIEKRSFLNFAPNGDQHHPRRWRESICPIIKLCWLANCFAPGIADGMISGW